LTAVRAEVLAIGDELVHGRLADKNTAVIARALEEAGVEAARFHVVGDGLDEAAAVIAEACGRAALVVATGGLGPTDDDRTRAAAAQACGVGLRFDEGAWGWITAHFARIGRTRVPESNRRQAEFPAGAEPLENPWGTAPGFALPIGKALFVALPGVPREMERMLERHVVPRARALGARPGALAIRCLHALGPSEAQLGERLKALMADGREPRVGITTDEGLLTVRVAAVAAAAEEATASAEQAAAEVRALLADDFVYEGEETLAAAVGARLLAAGCTVAAAESCTAGMIAAELGSVPGISAVLRGGIVAYDDGVKHSQLGVPLDTLAAHGAVSEPVAAAMAAGAAERLRARLAVAVTGIAGPGGGTPDKPVGMVCFGLALDGAVRAWTRRLAPLGRHFVRARATREALAAMLRALRGEGWRA
jgi:nicotinamide-nucleotide amidase